MEEDENVNKDNIKINKYFHNGNIGKNNYIGPNINIPGFICSPTTGLPLLNNPQFSPSPSSPSLSSNPYSPNYPLPPPFSSLPPSSSSTSSLPLQSLPFYSPPSPSPTIPPPSQIPSSQSNYLPFPNSPIMNIPPPPPSPPPSTLPIYGNGYPVNQPFGSYFCVPYCPQNNGNNISPLINNYIPPTFPNGPIPSNSMNPANLSPLGYGTNDLFGYGQINPQLVGGGNLPFSGAYIHTEPSNNIRINGQMANAGSENGLRRMVKEVNNEGTKIENNKKIIAEKERKSN
ncbi:hypothetical protein Mgra_00003239 [Meloidogyne graminicola]|uniref:Uncharacterized protein n=1 Tax=Meloidogyne graminicola TaxID=189291 RepID=A0A8S9ZVU6_9BILA|nr:hypothetical protein Mgra_00003239 [Meloidogyne graminicola]